jgi:hypothetical protein
LRGVFELARFGELRDAYASPELYRGLDEIVNAHLGQQLLGAGLVDPQR